MCASVNELAFGTFKVMDVCVIPQRFQRLPRLLWNVYIICQESRMRLAEDSFVPRSSESSSTLNIQLGGAVRQVGQRAQDAILP